MTTLLRNQVECSKCHDVIASLHRHDLQTCSCGATSIDGGRDYQRVSLVTGTEWPIDRSILIDAPLSNHDARKLLDRYKVAYRIAPPDGPLVVPVFSSAFRGLRKHGLVEHVPGRGWRCLYPLA